MALEQADFSGIERLKKKLQAKPLMKQKKKVLLIKLKC